MLCQRSIGLLLANAIGYHAEHRALDCFIKRTGGMLRMNTHKISEANCLSQCLTVHQTPIRVKTISWVSLKIRGQPATGRSTTFSNLVVERGPLLQDSVLHKLQLLQLAALLSSLVRSARGQEQNHRPTARIIPPHLRPSRGQEGSSST